VGNVASTIDPLVKREATCARFLTGLPISVGAGAGKPDLAIITTKEPINSYESRHVPARSTEDCPQHFGR
jgi:hypothetical protein